MVTMSRELYGVLQTTMANIGFYLQIVEAFGVENEFVHLALGFVSIKVFYERGELTAKLSAKLHI